MSNSGENSMSVVSETEDPQDAALADLVRSERSLANA